MANENVEQIARTFFLIDENFDKAYASAQSADERKSLQAQRDAARDTFWKAMADRLEDNNQAVQDLRQDLKDANDTLEEEIRSMESFARFVHSLSTAVKLAAALVTLASI